ncbi:uncharacterized protein Dana_GF19049 [Drosophila ananassae]|uniref:Fibrinogen C-terminal domain-containing protein n=1 Tax=Drosophila ananassae TaxID=7217 RepID=B3MZW6_DROAN|nr:uncharacterized protein Dana_GF19049 [Drosophila ananassae]
MIFPVVLLSVTFLGLFSASQGSDESCYLSEEQEDDCAAVCYPIVKPLLRYFEKINEKDSQILQLQKDNSELHKKFADSQQKDLEKYAHISKLETAYLELQKRHWDVQDKFQQLQSRIQDVESLKAQIKLLEEQIRALNKTSELAVVKNGEMLANQLREEIEKLRSLGRSGERSNPEATAQAKGPSLPDHCPGSQEEEKVIQKIQIGGADPFKVVCYSDKKRGSGWIIVYNKVPGSNKFNRPFEEYVSGFGDVGTADEDEFFIGLQRLHLLTNGEPYEVHLDAIFGINRREEEEEEEQDHVEKN